MREAAMLVLLRKPLRVIVTFCASDKIREPATTKNRPQEQRSVCESKHFLCGEIGWKIVKKEAG
jgi:hypothetical protein